MSEQFSLCIVWHVKPEHVEEFASRVQESNTETHKDKGVITFNWHKVVGEPTWILYEIWESQHDSDVHRQKPDVRAFFAQMPRLLAGDPTIFQLGPLI